MKIIRRLVLGMTILTAALFAVFWLFWFTKNDAEGPVITCDEEKYSVSIEATEEELLKGMHAWDEEDLDVTDSLIIENKKIIPDTKKVIITCAASDSSNNVSKYERTVTYTDYYSPHFQAKQPLRFAVGDESSVINNFTAADCIEGDITSRIKLEKMSGSSNAEGIQKYELSVSNNLGDTAVLPISVEFYTDTYEHRLSYPHIYLKEYIHYIKKGKKFLPTNLLKEMEVGESVYHYNKEDKKFYEMNEVVSEDGKTTEWKKKKKGDQILSTDIKYKSNVDTSKEGVYTVEYSYQDKNGNFGATQLIVVVE